MKVVGVRLYRQGYEAEETFADIWCETPDKEHTFEVVPLGTIDSRKKLWNEWNLTPTKFIGKPLTVQYQELTPKGIPRFPKGISIRDYE